MYQKYANLFDKRSYSEAGHTLPYRLMMPKAHNPAKQYPLHMILHGAAERGTDNETQVSVTSACVAPWATESERTARPAFVVAPQCPPDQEWVAVHWADAGAPLPPVTSMAWPGILAFKVLSALRSEFPAIDKDRIYISGGSMGGVGTWYFCQYRPELFAAAFPIAGSGDLMRARPFINNIALWAYGAELDEITPVESTRAMIAAIQKAGGKPHYTEIRGARHTPEFFFNAAGDPKVHAWMFGQRKGMPALELPMEIPETQYQGCYS